MSNTPSDIQRAVNALAQGTFVMTSRHEDKRAGVIVHAVLPCATEPTLICVSARKGHWIAPLIRDSRVFAICQLGPNGQLARKRFAQDLTEDEQGDPFEGVPVRKLATGAPVLEKCVRALDCEVVRHFDLEADHELYIGQVLAVIDEPTTA